MNKSKITGASIGILIISIIILIIAGIMFSNSQKYIPINKMTLQSSGIKDGIIEPQYGAASKDKIGAMPLESIPLNWSGAPKDTKSYAITIVDNDTVPIIGFPWIHWVTADIPANITNLPANASTTMAKDMVQGVNSYSDGVMLNMPSMKGFDVPAKDAAHYGGMVPVGFAHKYTITVYALNTKLNLKSGYTYNEFINDIQGHVVGMGTTSGVYNATIVHPPVAGQSAAYIKAHNGK